MKVILRRIRESKKFLDDSVTHAKEEGYAVTLFGRRRPIPELKIQQFYAEEFRRTCGNECADPGNCGRYYEDCHDRSQPGTERKRMKSRMILQVHDELLIETHPDEIETVKRDPQTADGKQRLP